MKRYYSFSFALVISLLPSCIIKTSETEKMDHIISYSGTHAESMFEGQRSMVGRVLLPPPTGDIDALIITSSGKEIKAEWPGWDRAMFIDTRWHGNYLESSHHRKLLWDQATSKVGPSQEYSIKILTRVYSGPSSTANEILLVSKEGQTVIDASICPLHKIPMVRQIEEVCSADAYPESFFPRRKRDFLNDGNVYLGSSAGLLDPTWKCPECRRRYDTWIQKYGSRGMQRDATVQ
jgi:hypothetical protein